MKSKKNILVSLSVFITVVFVLTLFGQQKGPLWDMVNNHESRIVALEATIGDLQNQVNSANTSILNLEASMVANINSLQNSIENEEAARIAADMNLQNDVNALQNHTHDYSELTGDAPFALEAHHHDSQYSLLEHTHQFAEPDWSSVWTPIAQNEWIEFTHDLNTTELYVVIIGRKPSSNYVHQNDFGLNRDEFMIGYSGAPGNPSDLVLHYEQYDKGAKWNTWGPNKIQVYRAANDVWWEEVRVMVWKLD